MSEIKVLAGLCSCRLLGKSVYAFLSASGVASNPGRSLASRSITPFYLCSTWHSPYVSLPVSLFIFLKCTFLKCKSFGKDGWSKE